MNGTTEQNGTTTTTVDPLCHMATAFPRWLMHTILVSLKWLAFYGAASSHRVGVVTHARPFRWCACTYLGTNVMYILCTTGGREEQVVIYSAIRGTLVHVGATLTFSLVPGKKKLSYGTEHGSRFARRDTQRHTSYGLPEGCSPAAAHLTCPRRWRSSPGRRAGCRRASPGR